MAPHSEDRCSVCGSLLKRFDHEVTEAVCENCGLVQRSVDELSSNQCSNENPEERVVSKEKKTRRDSNWKEDVEITDPSDQRLIEALAEMDAIAEKLQLRPQIRVRAAELVTDAWEQRFMHGRREDATIGASIYIACRESEYPRPLFAVAEVIGIPESKLHSTHQALRAELEIESEVKFPREYLPYLTDRLGLQIDISDAAATILNESPTVTGNPVGIAGAALYIAVENSRNRITFREIERVAGVTRETVWRKTNEIRTG